MPTLELPEDDRPVLAPRVIAGCRGPSSRSYRVGCRPPRYDCCSGAGPKKQRAVERRTLTESHAHGIQRDPSVGGKGHQRPTEPGIVPASAWCSTLTAY